jgi:hypothetical protein
VDLDSTGGVDDAALSALFMRAAEALDQSAALAEWGVRWQERAGRHAAAEKEAVTLVLMRPRAGVAVLNGIRVSLEPVESAAHEPSRRAAAVPATSPPSAA